MSGKIWFIGDKDTKLLNKQFESHLKHKEKIFILLDENTKEYCLAVFLGLFPILETAEIIEIKSGEKHKNIDTCNFIWKKLTDGGADRSSILINLGGGVICDIGGFSASVFKRGIRFYHCPTTLLAQADASIGGKTGVDFGDLKNQIGSFSNPEAVIIFPGFLKTLDHRQFLSGYAEIIKIALATDITLWHLLMSIDKPETQLTANTINRAIQDKQRITELDFKEEGERKKLNFGHTIGHAVESFKMNKKDHVLHGEAVAMGMICEAYISLQQELIQQDLFDNILENILTIYGKINLKPEDIPELLKLMGHDKKNIAGSSRFTLLCGKGKSLVDNEISMDLQEKSFQFYISI